MCGINGIYSFDASVAPPDRAELCRTRDAMHKRGPDGSGEWWDSRKRVALGHRRLSIIDLSERGAQPMVSADGRISIVFNGEIYNYRKLRNELASNGYRFVSESDTEVLLHLYQHFGHEMVNRLRGMFAFAIWDSDKRQLFLARDPYGIKPLYYSEQRGAFRFASQVKALLFGGGIDREPNAAGIVGFHLWGHVPEPHTLYRSIRALPAGHTLLVDENGPRSPQSFATVAGEFAFGSRAPAPTAELEDRVRAAALGSIRAHLVADVEVGVFLSAGIDSGALLGLMRDAGQRRIKALTLAFDEFHGTEEDESILASQVAHMYGADHIIRRVSRAEFESELLAIFDAMDQPSIDGVNTWLVAKAAREAGLKVALSGVGGDELFAGYPSFRQIPRWVNWLVLPAKLTGLAITTRRFLQKVPLFANRPKLAGLLEYGGSYPGAYLLRRALMLPLELAEVLEPELVSQGLEALQPLVSLDASQSAGMENPTSRVAALESAHYLRNQLLRDTDWAGMDHSLEIRTPLVDFHLLRELAASVPYAGGGRGKRALAHAPSLPLPDAVTHRTKTGFSVPTGQWLSTGPQTAPATKGLASRAWAVNVLQKSRPSNIGTAAA